MVGDVPLASAIDGTFGAGIGQVHTLAIAAQVETPSGATRVSWVQRTTMPCANGLRTTAAEKSCMPRKVRCSPFGPERCHCADCVRTLSCPRIWYLLGGVRSPLRIWALPSHDLPTLDGSGGQLTLEIDDGTAAV